MFYASIATITIFISGLWSATLFLFQHRKEAAHRVWAALSYTVSAWALGLCLTINAHTYETALFWGRFHNYVAILIIPLFVHFVYSLIGQKSKVVYGVYLYFCALLALHLVLYKQFIPSVRPIGEFNFYIEAGSLYWIFLASYFSLTTFGALRLAMALPKTSGLKKKQFTYVLVACSLGFIGGGTTFPMVYGLNIAPVGLGASVSYVVLITYAIVQHRVFDVSTLVANALSVMLTLLTLGVGYVFIWYAYLSFFIDRTSTSDLILNVLYLAFACECYFIVRPKLHAFNKTLLTKRYYSYAKVRDSLALFGEDLLEPEALIQQAHHLLHHDLKLPVSRFFVSKKLLHTHQTAAALLQWDAQKGCFDDALIHGLEQRLLLLSSYGINTVIDEADPELKSLMALLGAGMFLPFVVNDELLGLVFIAKRKGSALYTSDDFLVFDLLASKIKAGLSRALSHLYSKNALLSLAGSIAHEMRNPLSQIKASLDGIEQGLPLPNSDVHPISRQSIKKFYEYVGMGESAIKRGLQVISMILDEVKDKPIDRQKFNYLHAAQATQKAIAEYGYETEGERHKIHLEVKRDFIFNGDETLYLFVLFNLMKNALYYFKLDPQAKLTITVSQPYVIVRDTGPGIAQEHLPFLFDSFQTSGKQGGTGLGLSYCKRVMQAFGGDIRCHSLGGQYTEFILEFPEVSSSTWQQYQDSITERLRPFLCGKRVLVVDDDETIRISTQHILSDLDIHADHAEHGQQALQQLEQSSYDLMILDLNMPVLDGYATAEKIRAGVIPGYEQLPIIAHTTEVAYMAQVKTQKVGINAFVSKPCEPLVLLQTIEKMLQQPLMAPLGERATPTFSSLCGQTILVADDNETNRELIKYALTKHGIRTLEAAHGQAAIDQLEQNPWCAAVLMDIRMPGLNGLEATRLIRTQTSAYQSVPIIAITGDTDKDNIEAAFALGMDDYIVKPVDSLVLFNKLTALCHRGQEEIVEFPLFDFERLDHFKNSGIFKDGVNNSYVRQTTEHLMGLERSVQSQDFEGVHDALHFLKGSSFTIGAQAFAHLIKGYEQQTKKGDWPDDAYWFEKVKSLHGKTLVALQAHFN